MNYLENPVFICGHRKGGTTMMINLFDNANDAVVYPDDSGFFYMYYPKYDSKEYSDEEKLERLINRIAKENLGEVIERTKCTQEEKIRLYEKQENFIKELKKINITNFETKDILQEFISSYKKAFYEKSENLKIWIEKTTSTEIYATELATWYKNAKFIHIVRDPRDNWGSLKSGWDKRYNEYNDSLNRLKHSLLERAQLGLKMAIDNQEIIGKDRYKIIKYEEFTQDSEKYMKELSEFIGIEYNTNLLTPTTFGYSWSGNNFEGIKNTKPSSVNVNRWKERISDEDAALIEYYFEDVMSKLGYELCYSKEDRLNAARDHYKWYNFSTPYSEK